MPEVAAWSGATPLQLTPPPALPLETAPAAAPLPPLPAPPAPDHLPGTLTLDLGNGIAMDLVHIPAGSFLMGSPETEKDRYGNEPLHVVTISKPFYMGKFPVTQAQYEQIMGANPSQNKGKDLPVEKTTWPDAREFCKKLGEAAKRTVRLPTEAEWEYACRAGTRTPYPSGDDEEALKRVAWYKGNSDRVTHPVGQKEPNAFGLYDMIGNVWQRCQDWYGDYPAAAVTDPQGPAAGEWSTLRGGSAFDYPPDCRTACRGRSGPGPGPRNIHFFIGFRVVVEMAPQ
jgi:formylglycine-generating enzyme required for sulfatase activity